MLRSAALTAVFTASALAAPLFAQADPASDVAQSWRLFGTLKSYHADVKRADNRNVSMDVVVPGKMHVTMSTGMQVIRINADTWIYREGSWMNVPVAMPQMSGMGDTARTMGLKDKPEPGTYTITYLGSALVNGVAARHYRLARKDNSAKPVEMWIGPNHLPLQVMTQGDTGPMTVLYSNYNAVSDIVPPM